MAEDSSERAAGSPSVLDRRSFMTGTVTVAAAPLLDLSRSEVARAAPVGAAEGVLDVTLTVNGKEHRLALDPRTTLLDALRDHIGLVGTKKGCDHGQCGACTVHLDGQPVRACQTKLGDVGAAQVTTIEGVNGRVAEAVQAAWRKLDVVQCGYCQSGQIMSAIGLLSGNAKPSDSDIDGAMDGNICRCGTYQRIRAAIHEAARSLA
jgi:isoquinoline 1-oxidoreductase alpha subunit